MTTVSETIPQDLQPGVDAALAWFNQSQEQPFEVTGIVDPDGALAMGGARELQLVLCGGDSCQQRSFRVTATEVGFDVEPMLSGEATLAREPGGEVVAELDPPPGARRSWLSDALGRHRFVVLVFYRGFW